MQYRFTQTILHSREFKERGYEVKGEDKNVQPDKTFSDAEGGTDPKIWGEIWYSGILTIPE